MNQTQNEAPSLDHLDYEVRVRIAVAECLGFTWDRDSQAWSLRGGPHRWNAAVLIDGMPEPYVTDALPDYLNDPAAWGALMEKERISLVYFGGWRAFEARYGSVDDDSGRMVFGGSLASMGDVYASPGEAVCAAILRKLGKVVKP